MDARTTAPALILSEHERALVDRLVRCEAPDPSRFDSVISQEDEMFLRPLAMYGGNRNRALWRYLSFGKLMLSEVSQVVDWAFGGFAKVDSFLDFASGHGRFTRFLVQELHSSRVVASDIYTDAMAFQAKQFGVRAAPSCPRPEDYDPGQKFQVVFVASLFSHLPAKTFAGWLGRLLSLLTDDGVLLFSTLGMDLKPPDLAQTGGFAFARESESRSLSTQQYGKTFVAPEFVGKLLESGPEPAPGWRHVPHGFVGFQDLYLVSRGSRRLDALDYAAGVTGHVAPLRDQGSSRVLGGWAADVARGGEKIRNQEPLEVEILVDDQLSATCVAAAERPDVQALYGYTALRSGFSVSLPASQLAAANWVTVRAVSPRGERAVLALDSVAEMLRY